MGNTIPVEKGIGWMTICLRLFHIEMKGKRGDRDGETRKDKEEPKREKLVSEAYAREWNYQYDEQREKIPEY